jgi:putative ABC transport system ATP-binding protein
MPASQSRSSNEADDRETGSRAVATVVQTIEVTKSYGSGPSATQVLRGLSLDITRGQFVSILGPSGSGKTTLLNLMAGLDAPDSGRVLVDGRDLKNLADHQLADMRLKTMGFVFQAFNLIPSLTVEQNVSWPLKFSRYSRGEVHSRTAEALELVQVSGCNGRYPAEISGGEQQRVAIARALATSPTMLIADEPTGNLDSHTGRMILDLLRDLNTRDHMTVVMVTHNVFAASFGDRTLEMRDGTIVRDVGAASDAILPRRETAES